MSGDLSWIRDFSIIAYYRGKEVVHSNERHNPLADVRMGDRGSWRGIIGGGLVGEAARGEEAGWEGRSPQEVFSALLKVR